MPPVVVDPRRVRSFESEAAFEAWLSAHHASEPELWIKIHKKGSGLASITHVEAIDVCLCWGWIDGIRKTFDERSFLQRYTPRRKKSNWSRINRDNVKRLVAAGRMTAHGQRHVDAAKADGRWQAAYAPSRASSAKGLPADLRAAIAANPRAAKTLATLDRQNLFSLGYRTNHMKTLAGRARKIGELVATLARGEPIVRRAKPEPARTAKAKRRTKTARSSPTRRTKRA